MGDHRVHDTSDEHRTRAFVRAMLDDIRALEILIDRDLIERDVTRVGFEQEMYLVDSRGYPAPVAERVLEHLADDRFTTELARFNIEANLAPRPIGGDFLRAMEQGLGETLALANSAAQQFDRHVVLTGILPTLNHTHVSIDNLTPEKRYRCLNDSCMAVRGDRLSLEIDGIDRFESTHDCAVIEGANTSFQVHLQVTPERAVPLYNLAQLITAPLLAAAANSPILLNRRVWHETRVALFERTFEYRSHSQRARAMPSRVGFGDDWVRDSILEIFRENAMRHHVIMVRDPVEDPFEQLERGRVPSLDALSLHNGTVWRWNRPCYGVTEGRPHLRIENRALPAGPTVIDQVANAALFYGLMQALADSAARIPERLSFDDARCNFLAAAQHGLDARFNWLDGRRPGARDLLQQELLPAAREGLQALAVPDADIERYLDVAAARIDSGRTGARWLLDSMAAVNQTEREALCREAVAVIRDNQANGTPVHRWSVVRRDAQAEESLASRRLRDVMTTNLFTVRPDDLVDLATSMMDWKHVRHVPVETNAGELVGLLSTRELLRLRSWEYLKRDQAIPVSEIMQTEPPAMSPDASLQDAFTRILESDSGCVLVVERGQLLGIVTERDLLAAVAGSIAALDGDHVSH